MEVLGNATLPKRGCRSVLALINDNTGETELVAIAWVDRNRRFFITTTCGLGEGEMIQRKRLRQLDKSGRAPPDKVIIEVAQPMAIRNITRAPAPLTGATGYEPTSCGWTAISAPNIGTRGSTSVSSASFASTPRIVA